MRRAGWTLVTLVILLGGCGRTPVTPRPRPGFDFPAVPPTFGARDSVFTDRQVTAAVYTGYFCPDGFYREDGPVPYYVNTVSIMPVCCRPNEWRELATEDTAQARAWVDSTVSDHPMDFGPAILTERYFEFHASLGARYRVHRSSYLVPLAFSPAFFYSDSVIGTFHAEPIDSTSARGLAEYLWFKWNRQTWGTKALSSFPGGDDGATVVHVLYEVLVVVGDFDMYDDIRLYRLELRISRRTGEVILRRILQRRIRGAPR